MGELLEQAVTVGEPAVLDELLAVIRGDDDQRFLEQTGALHALEERTDGPVDRRGPRIDVLEERSVPFGMSHAPVQHLQERRPVGRHGVDECEQVAGAHDIYGAPE